MEDVKSCATPVCYPPACRGEKLNMTTPAPTAMLSPLRAGLRSDRVPPTRCSDGYTLRAGVRKRS